MRMERRSWRRGIWGKDYSDDGWLARGKRPVLPMWITLHKRSMSLGGRCCCAGLHLGSAPAIVDEVCMPASATVRSLADAPVARRGR